MSLIMDALNKARQERQAAQHAKSASPEAIAAEAVASSRAIEPETVPAPNTAAGNSEGMGNSVFIGETEFLDLIRGADARTSAAYEPAESSHSNLFSRKWISQLTLICALSAAIILSVTTLSRFWVIESEIFKKALPNSQTPRIAAGDSGGVSLPANFSIQGILWDAEDPIVLIGNKTLRAGDLWNGHQLLSIQPDGVTILDAAGMRHQIKVQA